MAEAESSGSSAIVGPQYCSPQSVQLKITKKRFSLGDGNFIITDINDNLIFKVKAAFFTLHCRRTLLDASGNPVVTLHKKIMTMHDTWEIFKGESAKANDLLFSVRQSSMFQWKWKFSMDVFFANNGAESVPDFKVKVRWFKKTCAIYAGDSSNIVAKMEKKNGSFIVTLEPNIDSALIASIILVLDYYFNTYSAKAVKSVFKGTEDIIGS